MNIPTIELSCDQAIHAIDSSSFEILGPSSSFEDLSSEISSEESQNDSIVLEVPMAAVEPVEYDSTDSDPIIWAAPAPTEEFQRAALLSATITRESAGENRPVRHR